MNLADSVHNGSFFKKHIHNPFTTFVDCVVQWCVTILGDRDRDRDRD